MSLFLSISIYSFILLFPYILYTLWRPSSFKSRFFHSCFALFPAFLAASLRSTAVGTDTDYYAQLFSNLDLTHPFFVDPLFWYSWAFSKALGASIHTVLTLHSAYCLVFFSLSYALFPSRVLPFAISILPVLMVDSTFNALRVGAAIASAAPLFAFSLTGRFLPWPIYLIPGLLHYSLIPVFLLHLKRPIQAITAFVVFALAYYYSPSDYFGYKYVSYSDMLPPSSFSGLVPLALALLFLSYPLISSGIAKAFRSMPFLVSLLYLIAGITLLGRTYASLRFLSLSAFASSLVSSANFPQTRNRSLFSFLYILAGLGCILNFMRQIFSGSESVLFVPYQSFL